jgi:ribosomal protein S18 acetylase RimI-like enzyme
VNVDSSPNSYWLTAGGPELCGPVAPLWLQPRQHHAGLSPRWASQLLAAAFEDRRAGLIAKASAGLLVLLATTNPGDIAYCVSTVMSDGKGEVDSLYVAEAHRQHRGSPTRSCRGRWTGSPGGRAVTTIVVDVLSVNDSARRFYERYGFPSRSVRMVRNPDASLA